MVAAIEVKNLSKDFSVRVQEGSRLRGLFHPVIRQVQAVRDISFSVESGETLAFIGPNGAGKSTTIKMLCGILFPSSGSARVLGHTPWQSRRTLAMQVGSVFGQKSQLWFHLPPRDTFRLISHIYELEKYRYEKRLAELVDVFELGHLLSTPVRKLSLGQRMRCEIAACLLHSPQVLFLDEPTIGLDVVAKRRIRELIAHINRTEGVTVFLTSHDTGDIESVCRRVMVINHGQVILDTSPQVMRRQYLRHKMVGVLLDQEAGSFVHPGVSVLKHKGGGLKLKVDTSQTSIDEVYSALRLHGSVLDIYIADPSLDEVIEEIYGEDRPSLPAGGELSC